MERVRGQRGRVTMAGPEAAELGLDLVGAEARRIEHRCALGQLGGGGGRSCRRRAALLGKRDPLDPAVGRHQRQSDEVAAGRTAGRAREGSLRGGSAACDVAQVLL